MHYGLIRLIKALKVLQEYVGQQDVSAGVAPVMVDTLVLRSVPAEDISPSPHIYTVKSKGKNAEKSIMQMLKYSCELWCTSVLRPCL